MSETSAREAADVCRWWEESVRPFLSEHSADRVEGIEREVSRVRATSTARLDELPVCFLGNSGVGKSTLLNALVAGDMTVLPQGGVGPLTAQATLVRHSPERYFKVSYLPRKRVNELLFALERHHEVQLRRQGLNVEEKADELTAELSEEDREELTLVTPAAAPGESDDTPQDDRIEALRRQAKIVVKGNQYAEADLPYLLDALRMAIDNPPRWQTSLQPDDRKRMDRVRELLGHKGHEPGEVEHRAGEDMRSFLVELHHHAAGFLSPLIRTIEVGWEAEFLRDGLVLVDLPGLGVANDEYRRVTAEWIRRARAVTLVVDRSGINESSADLLRSTGFLNALLHESHDPEKPPVHLVVAVVKLDLSADDARNLEKQTRQPPYRKWVEHFEGACKEAIQLIKDQVREELRKIAEAGPEETREERKATLERVRDSLEVHPVSALEFRRLLQEDDEERARISRREESHVPGLVASMERLAQEHARWHEERQKRLIVALNERIASSVSLLAAQWTEEARAEGDAKRIADELEAFLAPRRKQLLVRQGGFREFLRESLPAQIEARVGEASATARDAIAQYLRRLETYHWAVLRAAVRRGGTFVGSKHVDLPNELTLRFEEPIAVVWSKHILTALRRRTNELGQDYLQLVGEIAEWARERGSGVQPKLVEALREDLQAELRDVASVGKEAIDELRDRVKKQLYDRVSDRVRKSCQTFIESKRGQGPGTKARIVQFFHQELLDAVLSAATPAARRVLSHNYEEVEREISATFARVKDPLDRAAAEIVDRQRVRLEQGDSQRQRILERAEQILSARPVPAASRSGA